MVVVDRGFRGSVVPKVCEELGLEYITRIHEDFWVQVERSREWQLVSSLRPGKYKGAEIGKKIRMRGYVVVHEWADKKRGRIERWYLQMNLPDRKGFIVGMYGKRMQIEEGFRDLKRVMHGEEYTAKVPKEAYMEKCIGISSLSYAIQVSLGRYEAVGKVEERRSGWLIRWRNAMLRGVRYVSELLGAFVAAICMNIWRVEHSFP